MFWIALLLGLVELFGDSFLASVQVIPRAEQMNGDCDVSAMSILW
jgi:hypothetical protein